MPVTISVLTEEDFASISDVIDQRLTAFEERMAGQFSGHMNEIEDYYGQRDRELQRQIRINRDDIKSINVKLDDVLSAVNGRESDDSE